MRRFGLILLALSLPLLAACGSDATSVDPAAHAAVLNAAKVTSQQRGAYMSMTGTLSLAGSAGTLTGEGVQDLSGNRGSFQMHVEIAGESVDMQAVFDNGVMYMGSKLFGDLPGGKKWVKIDLKKGLSNAGLDASGLGSADTTKLLDQLAASGDVEKLGSETIRGVETTHYRATIDVAKVPNSEALKKLGVEYEPTEVWIDAQNRVRRMTFAYSYDSGGKRISQRFTEDLYRYGASVFVEVPSDEDVYDATALATQGLQDRLNKTK